MSELITLRQAVDLVDLEQLPDFVEDYGDYKINAMQNFELDISVKLSYSVIPYPIIYDFNNDIDIVKYVLFYFIKSKAIIGEIAIIKESYYGELTFKKKKNVDMSKYYQHFQQPEINYYLSLIDKDSFIKWAKLKGFKLLSDETAAPENETAPKNKRGQHWEIKRAEIKGIAKALLAFNPKLCTDDKGNITAVKIWASINDHAHKFWSSGEPPIKDQNSARKAIKEAITELGLDKK